MSKQTTKPEATEKEQPRIKGNRRPAVLEVEFAESELEVKVWLEIFTCHGESEGYDHVVKCELTGEQFTVHTGGLIYAIDGCVHSLEGYLHPQTVARGEAFMLECLRKKANRDRDAAYWRMKDAVMYDAAAERPITFLPPKIERA